ncbi:hypothetical protein ACFZDG_35660 [Kitasatospora xanthocidica]|uniref:hypothetical protein n=1 Tax=Kitasatospora xanthocidica TaxID=83382 RepID=UPI0036EB0CB3
MGLFVRRAMALAGPLTSNGQVIACPKCGTTANHQIKRPKRHNDPHAVIRCRSGHEFSDPAVPADVINRIRFASEGKVQVRTRTAEGEQIVVKGVIAKDSMAEDPKGAKKGAALTRGRAATAAKTGAPAVPVPAARPAGSRAGGGALAASINLLAAGLNTVSATVSTVGAVAGATGQVAGAVATTATAAAKVGGEGLGLARDSVRAGTKALDGKIKKTLTDAQHAEAARVRAHTSSETAQDRLERADIRTDKATEAAAVRQHRANEAAAIRAHRANEAARLRAEREAAKQAERAAKVEAARLRGEAAERALRRSGGRRKKNAEQAEPEAPQTPSVDLGEFT